MKLERLMDIVTRFSLIFVLLTFILIDITDYGSIELEFLIVCLITFVCSVFFKEKKPLKYFIALVELIPIIFIRNKFFIVFASAATIYSLYYLCKLKREIKYSNFIKTIEKGLILFSVLLLLIIALLCSGRININTYIKASGIYVCLFLVVSITLLRDLRYKSFEGDNKKINKINISVLAIVIVPAVCLSIESVRNGITWFINKIIYFIECIACYIIDAYLYVLNKIFGSSSFTGNTDPIGKDQSADDLGKATMPQGRTGIKSNTNNEMMAIIVKVVIVLILAFIIARIFKNRIYKDINGAGDYSEEIRIKNKRESLWSKIRPKTYAERIRSYYYNFLKISTQNGIKLKNSDTTLDINEKSETNFDRALIDKLRGLYIKVRYSDYNANRQDVKEASNCLKEIKREIPGTTRDMSIEG